MNLEPFKRYVMVIDPAMKRPELESFNFLSSQSPIPLTYHLPALVGFESIRSAPQGMKGIIVFGSLASVNDQLPWQGELGKWLRPVLERGTAALGICYGHQMFAHLFGGKVDYHSADQGKYVGLRRIDLKAHALWDDKPLSAEFCVSHNQVVTELPPGFQCIGSSAEVKYDAMTHQSLPIVSFQCHPEATVSFAERRGMALENFADRTKNGHRILMNFLQMANNRN